MMNRKRVSALLLCVSFILVLFVSSAYLVHEAGHHCAHEEECPVCRTIAVTKSLLRAFGLLLPALAAVLAPAVRLRARQLRDRASVYTYGTLVSWKIRLND
jgi:hypothetical protein